MKPKFKVGEIVEAEAFKDFLVECKIEEIYKACFGFKRKYRLSFPYICYEGKQCYVFFIRREKDIKKLGERK